MNNRGMLMRKRKSGEPIMVYGFIYHGNQLHAVVFDKGQFFNPNADQRVGLHTVPAKTLIPFDVDTTNSITKRKVLARVELTDPAMNLFTCSDGAGYTSKTEAFKHEMTIVAEEFGVPLSDVHAYCQYEDEEDKLNGYFWNEFN